MHLRLRMRSAGSYRLSCCTIDLFLLLLFSTLQCYYVLVLLALAPPAGGALGLVVHLAFLLVMPLAWCYPWPSCCCVLYCSVLYCTILYCTVLHCAVLYCIILYCTVLYCTLLYNVVSGFICTVLYCTVLYCTLLYCTILYCTVLYYTEYPNKLI